MCENPTPRDVCVPHSPPPPMLSPAVAAGETLSRSPRLGREHGGFSSLTLKLLCVMTVLSGTVAGPSSILSCPTPTASSVCLEP